MSEEPRWNSPREWVIARQERLRESEKVAEKLRIIEELAQTGGPARRSATALVDALRDPDRQVRLAAAHGLATLGPFAADNLSFILPFLDVRDPTGDDDELRGELLLAVAQMGAVPYSPYGDRQSETIPILVGLLRHRNPKIRDRATLAIGAGGQYAREAVPDLVRLLDDTGDGDVESLRSVRAGAISALGHIGPAASSAVPKLLSILRTRPKEACFAIGALGEIGTAHPEVVPVLISVLKDSSDRWQRWFAAHNLGRIGPEAEEAIPTLLKILEQKEGPGSAERKVSLFGARVPVLDRQLQGVALYALGCMGPAAKAAVPIMTSYAAGRQLPNEVRASALRALERLGPLAKEAVPDLILMLKEPDPGYDVPNVLLAIGKDAIPALIELLKRREKLTGLTALGILARMGPDALAAREAIADLTNHPDVGRTALEVLRHLDKYRKP